MSSSSRLQVLATCFCAALVVVFGHLAYVMLWQHELWAQRGQGNRWAFRMIPSLRGSLRDRDGRVLVHDQPTLQVSMYYLRFRLYHAVGAAVHGATEYARRLPGREQTSYEYSPGPLGPEAAARDLLAMPTAALRPGLFDKQTAGALATAVTTVLSTTSGMARREVFRALRERAAAAPGSACGDALPGHPREQLLGAYDRILEGLKDVDRLLAQDLRRGERAARLLVELDRLRIASLDRKKTKGEDSPFVEELSWPLAQSLPFELAARLRLGAQQPGIDVQPSVTRIHLEPAGTALRLLLGATSLVGDSVSEDRKVSDQLAPELPGDWQDDFVPDEMFDAAPEREAMQERAQKRLEVMTMTHERWGVIGAEAAFDEDLSGRIGLRLVERDSQQREHAMWGQLRVRCGEDVSLTLDSALQHIAQEIVRDAHTKSMAAYAEEKDQKRADVAFAVIDAGTGDVLALAGEPAEGTPLRYLPGVGWRGNAELGSLVKPFVLVEQLESEIAGRPHVERSTIAACDGRGVEFGKTKLSACGKEKHWEEGRDPVMALAESCNSFFYQVAIGLGDEGVTRALRRFGMYPAAADTAFAPCWQQRVEGIPWHPPQPAKGTLLPRRAIGYGLQASPLAVARGYAAIATGRLPTLGARLGPGRPVLDLGLDADVLQTVRNGLEACVKRGTGKRVPELARFGVLGKTGTAEVGTDEKQNNASFAGYLPAPGVSGVQLCFCAVLYWVPNGEHGADAAGGLIARFLCAVAADPELAAKYLPGKEGK